MKIALRKNGVFLAINEALQHFRHVSNVFKHFLESRLRLKQYDCTKRFFFLLVWLQAYLLIALLHCHENDIQILLQKFHRDPFSVIEVCLDYRIEANRRATDIDYPNDAVVFEHMAILSEDISPEGVVNNNNWLVP